MRAIDADLLLEGIDGGIRTCKVEEFPALNNVRNLVMCSPSVETERHGKWMIRGVIRSLNQCSECGAFVVMRGFGFRMAMIPYRYCPECGAKMDARV